MLAVVGTDKRPEGPKGRQFAVSLALTGLGVAVLVCGVVIGVVTGRTISLIATAAGAVMIVVFGTRALGAHRTAVSVGKEGVSAEANYAAPKPARQAKRRLWLPRSHQPQDPQNSEGTEPAED